jgi:hypothetical protein
MQIAIDDFLFGGAAGMNFDGSVVHFVDFPMRGVPVCEPWIGWIILGKRHNRMHWTIVRAEVIRAFSALDIASFWAIDFEDSDEWIFFGS